MVALIASLLLASAGTPVCVIGQGFVLGTSTNGVWKKPTDQLLKLDFPIQGHRLSVGKTAGTYQIEGIEKDEDFSVYSLKGNETPRFPLVAGRKPEFPRAIAAIAPSNATYLKTIKGLLEEAGLPKAEAKIESAYRVDLDGDGTDEVLICATNCKPEDTQTAIDGAPVHAGGDYCLLFLRSVEGGSVKTHLIAKDYKKKKGDVLVLNHIESIADLDGDSTYEVILSWEYYEGSGAEMWGFDGRKPRKLLAAGVGV